MYRGMNISRRAVCQALLAVLLSSAAVAATRAQEAKSPPAAVTQFADAAAFQNNGAYELALEEWTSFLKKYEKDPLAPKARHYKAVCLMQLKRFGPAEVEFAEVIQKYPKLEYLEDAHLNLAWCRYSLARNQDKPALFTKAAEAFQTLFKKYPKTKHAPQGLYFLGESLYLSGKVKESVEPYQRLLKEHAESDYKCDTLYALGVTRQDLKQYAQAGELYDTFLAQCKENALATEVLMRKADTILARGGYADAEKIFAQVAATPNFESADYAVYRRAFCFSNLEKPGEAGGLFAAVVDKYPKSVYRQESMIAAGRSFYVAGKNELAAKWMRQTLQEAAAKHGTEAAHWLCRLHLKEGKPDQAAAVAAAQLPKAKAGEEYFVHLQLDQADALFEQKSKRAAARDLYLAIAEKSAEHALAPQALYNAAFACLELKEFKPTVEIAQRFLKAYEKDALVADVRFVLAESLLQLKQYAEAEAQFRTMVESHAGHVEIQNWRVRWGLCLYLQKKYADVERAMSESVAELTAPEAVAEAHHLVGASRFFQNKFDAALAALQASLKAKTDWRQADETLLLAGRCQIKLKNTDEAKQTLARLVEDFPNSGILDQAHYRWGEAHYAANEFPQAGKKYEFVAATFKTSPYAPYALHGKGWSELKTQRFEDAASSFTALLENYSDHALAGDAHFGRAMGRRQTGNHKGVLEDITAYLATDPAGDARSDALYEKGLAESALKDHKSAIATFQGILTANAKYPHADKVLYELAWAHKTSGDDANAVKHFGALSQKHAQSPLAAEASFHVGEGQYAGGKYGEAVKAYSFAKDKADSDSLKEKALYKLGWSHYQLGKYPVAMEQFAAQVSAFPKGALVGDGQFMTGECAFKALDYKAALAAFEDARKYKPSSDTIAVLTLLHGGQAAGQLKQWKASVGWLDDLIENHAKSIHVPEAHFERGRARYNLKEMAAAKADYGKAADLTRGELGAQAEVGARARFMLGELLFEEKKYAAATKEFQRVMFGWGAEKAIAKVKNWQAKSGFEAGRCAEVRIKGATDARMRATLISDAKRFYDYVVRKHPDHELVVVAKKRLASLAKL